MFEYSTIWWESESSLFNKKRLHAVGTNLNGRGTVICVFYSFLSFKVLYSNCIRKIYKMSSGGNLLFLKLVYRKKKKEMPIHLLLQMRH